MGERNAMGRGRHISADLRRRVAGLRGTGTAGGPVAVVADRRHGAASRSTGDRDRARELVEPVLPLAARAANRVLARGAARRWPFDPEEIKSRARRLTGLTDFGADVPLDEPLAALCADLDAGPPMHPIGRFTTVRLIVTSLVNRLRLQRLTEERPEIFDRPVPRPLIIVGLPRSGTTLLHRLIA